MKSYYPVAVLPLPNYILKITFDNNEIRLFDVKPYLSDNYFAPIANRDVFNSVKTTPLSIEWMGEIDICPDELYYNSIPFQPDEIAESAPSYDK